MTHEKRDGRRSLPNDLALAHVATCPVCGKRSYRDRKTAKRAGRIVTGSGSFGVYKCGQYYHWGNLHDRVRRGELSRRI